MHRPPSKGHGDSETGNVERSSLSPSHGKNSFQSTSRQRSSERNSWMARVSSRTPLQALHIYYMYRINVRPVSVLLFQHAPSFHMARSAAGETVSVALCARTPGTDAVTSELDFGWFTQNEGALLRRAFNTKGEYCFTPLFSLRHKVKRSLLFPWRGTDETECPEEHV